jgi:hypothetical protein
MFHFIQISSSMPKISKCIRRCVLVFSLNGSSLQLANWSSISSNTSCVYDVKFVFRGSCLLLSQNSAWFSVRVCTVFHSPVTLSVTSMSPVTVCCVAKLSALFKIVHLLLFNWLAHFETELFESSRLRCGNFTAHESSKCVTADGCFVLHIL